MIIYDYNEGKDELLRKNRGIGFEDIQDAVGSGNLLEVIPHPNKARYPNQRVLIVKINNYVYECPYVRTGDRLFLKTIYPSRKLTKIYLGKNK